LLASEAPVPPSSSSPTPATAVASLGQPAGSSLPVTGNNAGAIAILGMLTLSAGLTLWGLSRRRPISG
jgi:LPXTG-motif cell wall-anchored protein